MVKSKADVRSRHTARRHGLIAVNAPSTLAVNSAHCIGLEVCMCSHNDADGSIQVTCGSVLLMTWAVGSSMDQYVMPFQKKERAGNATVLAVADLDACSSWLYWASRSGPWIVLVTLITSR